MWMGLGGLETFKVLSQMAYDWLLKESSKANYHLKSIILFCPEHEVIANLKDNADQCNGRKK